MVFVNFWTLSYGFKMAAPFQALQPHATVFNREKREGRKSKKEFSPSLLSPLQEEYCSQWPQRDLPFSHWTEWERGAGVP